MTRLSLLAAAAALVVATPAFAFHCPTDAAAIDHALATLDLGEETETQAQALRDQGMEQHEAGDHAEAENTLSEAMRLILNSVE